MFTSIALRLICVATSEVMEEEEKKKKEKKEEVE